MSGGAQDGIRVIGGSPSDEELAAIAAVFTQLLLERSASSRPIEQEAAPSRWMRSRRAVRAPLAPRRPW